MYELYRALLKDVDGIEVHGETDVRYQSNYWLDTITIDPLMKVKGQDHAYEVAIQGAVGGAAGVVHGGGTLHTACEPNANIEAMRMFLDARQIEDRPLRKPMHKQPVYKNAPAYLNGVSEDLFKNGMCLPSDPYVTDDDVRYIVDSFKEAIVG